MHREQFCNLCCHCYSLDYVNAPPRQVGFLREVLPQKTEVFHRRSCPACESVELATLEWVSWFNEHRLLSHIGYIPPAEAEAD